MRTGDAAAGSGADLPLFLLAEVAAEYMTVYAEVGIAQQVSPCGLTPGNPFGVPAWDGDRAGDAWWGYGGRTAAGRPRFCLLVPPGDSKGDSPGKLSKPQPPACASPRVTSTLVPSPTKFRWLPEPLLLCPGNIKKKKANKIFSANAGFPSCTAK